MTSWEFAELSNPHTGKDGIIFSRPQDASVLREFSARLQRGVKAEQSYPQWIHLNLNHTNVVYAAGILGELGWDLVSHACLTGGHEYFMFKRPLPPSSQLRT